jgi:alkyl hydroperoxide reductase subunit AhpC
LYKNHLKTDTYKRRRSMGEEMEIGCARPTGGPVGEAIEQKEYEKQKLVKEVSAMVKVGKKAPDFIAPAYQQGKFVSVKLSEYLGKWVALCFYPGDFTFVWATEISAVAERYPEFQKLGVEILSMSIDSVFVHKMWVDNELSKMVKGGIPFPMLSDAGGKVGAVYGVYDEDAGVETRGRFIIDPEGVIQGYEVLTPPVGRNVQEAVRQIQAFQHVRNSKGTEATPSGWKPGKVTLKPGPDLVGKVWEVWKTEMAFD